MQQAKSGVISRRKLGKTLVSSAAALALAMSADAAPDQDSRVTEIEADRAQPLSEDQKKTILESIKSNDDTWRKSRKSFTVPDQTEPDFVFKPTGLPGVKP